MLTPEILQCFYSVSKLNEGRIANTLGSSDYVDEVSNTVLEKLYLKSDFSEINCLKAFMESLFFRTMNDIYKKQRTFNKYIDFVHEVPDCTLDDPDDEDPRLEQIAQILTPEERERVADGSQWAPIQSRVKAHLDPDSTYNKCLRIYKMHKAGEIPKVAPLLQELNILPSSYRKIVRKLEGRKRQDPS